MFKRILFLMAGGFLVVQALGGGVVHSAQEFPPMKVVDSFDLQRYLGKWYEVAAIPQRFQKNCVATTATYSLRADGKVDVLNECRKHSLDGRVDRAHGKAWIPDPSEPAKLVVQFFWPFQGDYWVIELGEKYDYAVVGHPSRDYLWILSRSPQLPSDLLDQIYVRMEALGYDVSRIERTLQPLDLVKAASTVPLRTACRGDLEMSL